MANEVDWPLAPPLATLGTSWGEPPDYRCGLIEAESESGYSRMLTT
jgi:hypothetical protein